MDGDVAQRSQGVCNHVCVPLSKVSKVEGEKVPSGHSEIEMAFFFLGIEQSLNLIVGACSSVDRVLAPIVRARLT